MKIKQLWLLSRDEVMRFGNASYNAGKALVAGHNVGAGEIPGLQMSLNEMTGMVSIDAPGKSTMIHVSKCCLVLEPSISPHTPIAPPPAGPRAEPGAAARKPPASEPPKFRRGRPKAELDEEQGFDTSGDDIDDAEVAKLMQGSEKKALVKKKRGRPPKAKPAEVEMYEDEEVDDAGD